MPAIAPTTAVATLLVFALGPVACRRPTTPPPAPAIDAAATSDSGGGVTAGGIDRRRPAPPDVANPPPEAEARPSGLRTRVIKAGTGTRHPAPSDYVEVFYSGWQRGGGFFEGTGDGERIRFDRQQIVPGLDEGIGLMVEGEKRRFWVPFALAYGARRNHANAPQEDMTFDVELLRIVPLPSTPPDAARPPASARRTRSGLRYVYLGRGRGSAHPTADSFVRIQQTMWQPNGRLFYTSLQHANAVRMPMMDLTPGAEEAVMMMVPGDRLRLWLTGKLAYGEAKPDETPMAVGFPAGPIVIEIELFAID